MLNRTYEFVLVPYPIPYLVLMCSQSVFGIWYLEFGYGCETNTNTQFSIYYDSNISSVDGWSLMADG